MNIHRVTAVMMAAVWGFGTPGAFAAANWEFLPTIGVGALASDNYTLTPISNEKVDVVGGWIDAEFELRARTPLTEFSLAPRLESTFLPDDEEWESNDKFVLLDWRYTGQRVRAALRGEYDDEATLSSELPSSDTDGDLGEPDGGDGGFVQVRNRRERFWVAPSLSFDMTERSKILLSAAYDDVSYEEEIPGDNVDYSSTYAAIGYGFRTSPTRTLTVRGTASRYERDTDSAEADSYGAQIEWASRLTEVTRWYVRVGAREVDVTEAPGSTVASGTETGYDGGAGADWAFKVTRLFIDATVSVQPNATGRIIERDQLRLRLTRQLGPRLIGFLGTRATRDTALADDLGTFRDREYATGSLGMEWRMTREFSLVGQYDLTWQEYEGQPSDATANAFQLSVVYARLREE